MCVCVPGHAPGWRVGGGGGVPAARGPNGRGRARARRERAPHPLIPPPHLFPSLSSGLSVALVERDDFGSGTSSKSTKLVHGGVRYLEKAFSSLDAGQL